MNASNEENATPAEEDKTGAELHPRDVIAKLAEVYPQTFFSDGRQVRPLAIGIVRDLLAEREEKLPGLSARVIRRALRFYTSAAAYHRAVIKDLPRVNLQGEEAGQTSDEEKAYAQEKLDAIPKPKRKQDKPAPARKSKPKGRKAGKPRPAPEKKKDKDSKDKEEKPMEDKLAALAEKFNVK